MIEPGLLWRRYLLSIGIVAVFLAASHGFASFSLSGGAEASATINVSGRQRMLSQRILGLVAREHAEPGNASLTAALDESIALFSTSHEALMAGGAMGLSERGASRRRPLYEQDMGGGVSLDDKVQLFLHDLQVARGRADGDQALALQHLHDLAATDLLLTALDDVVHAHEDVMVARVQRMRTIGELSFLAAMLVLLLEARFIFWPAQKAVASAFAEVLKNRDTLAENEHELRLALAQADAARKEANKALSTRSSFISTMGNDLQPPVKVLRDYVKQVMQMELPTMAQRQLGLINRAAEQMEIVIDDVIDGRRIEEGLLQLHEEPVQLAVLAENIVADHRIRAQRQGLCLAADIDPSLPEWALLDQGRTEQILHNLLSNAVKYTYEGKIRLRMLVAGDSQWVIEVFDTGEGMSPEALRNVFKKFEAGKGFHAPGGTKLGLPISHDLAELMGGTLTVDSVVGEGSTFRVTLPLKPTEAPEGHMATAAA